MEIILLILFGLLGGIAGGMGMGGGTITIPLLVLLAHFEQHLAQCINLIIFLPMSIIAIIIHCKNHLIDFKNSIKIIIPALLTAILGAVIAHSTKNQELSLYFGIFLAVLGIIQFISIFFMKKKQTINKVVNAILYRKRKAKKIIDIKKPSIFTSH